MSPRSFTLGTRELLDAVVGGVRDEDVSARVDADAIRGEELPVLATGHPPLREERPGVRELLDAVVAGVSDVDVPAAVHRDATGLGELAVPADSPPPNPIPLPSLPTSWGWFDFPSPLLARLVSQPELYVAMASMSPRPPRPKVFRYVPVFVYFWMRLLLVSAI